MRVKGRPSLEALKATVELEWQQLKEIRRRITPAVTAASVRVIRSLCACVHHALEQVIFSCTTPNARLLGVLSLYIFSQGAGAGITSIARRAGATEEHPETSILDPAGARAGKGSTAGRARKRYCRSTMPCSTLIPAVRDTVCRSSVSRGLLSTGTSI